MTSYSTVQVVAFVSPSLDSQDYIAVYGGNYTVSNGSIAFSGGGGSGSGNSLFFASAISAQVTGSNVTLDLSATGVTAASSYNSLTVDSRGRVTAAQVVVAVSSGTSLIPTSAFSTQVGSSNVTLDLPALITAGPYVYITVDKYGRATAGDASLSTRSITGSWTTNSIVGSWTTNAIVGSWTTNSIVGSWTTNSIVGVWTSGVSSSDVQGLGSTWTVSRISSAQSILANAVWASGFSGLGSIATISRVSSDKTIIGAEVWSSGFSGPHLSTITVREGGTGIVTYAVGDVLFAWSASSLSRLPIGTAGQVIKARSDGTIWWSDDSTGGGASGSGVTFWEAMSFTALGY